MTLTLQLTKDQERRLVTEAERAGITPEEFALRRLFSDEHNLGLLAAMASEEALADLWDTPEEDEAWRYLQPAT